MLGYLFRGLTASPARGAPLFGALTAEARRRHWFLEGKVADTLDGRFAVLVTVTALAVVRLEQLGDSGVSVSVALIERFVEVMESEHRELGLGDPKLGNVVRKLVGALGRRTELWRSAIARPSDWSDATGQSLYSGEAGETQALGLALAHATEALKALWSRLASADLAQLAEGRLA